MSDKRRARLIFDRWKADLTKKDRRFNKLAENFDELFFDMYNSSISFETAHEFIKDAAVAHSPNHSLAKRVYQGMEKKTGKAFEDFYKDWRESIGTQATSSFFNWFSIDGEKKEDMSFGNMSPQEYSKQRKYAEQFPRVDLEKLREQLKAVELIDAANEVDLKVDL